MTTPSITWDQQARRLSADPAATIALSRSAWEAAGASFTELDDGQGEMPGLATATIDVSSGPVVIGVLDYGESSTYLLVPGSEPDRFATTAAVLELLESVDVLCIARDLLDLADGTPVLTLEERLVDLERQFVALQQSVSAPRSGAKRVRGDDAEAGWVMVPLKKIPGTIKWYSDDKGFGFIEPRRTDKSRGLKLLGGGKGRGVVGRVKWFDRDKGFGFITPDDGGKDLFVHHTGILGEGSRSLAQGAKVSYEVEPAPEKQTSRRDDHES